MADSLANLKSFTKGHNGMPRPRNQTPYGIMVDLQRLAHSAAHNPKTTPSALAQLMRAICECEERKRILRMKPKPKDIDVDPRNRHPRVRAVQAQILNAAEPEQPALDVEAEPVPTPKPTISTPEVGKSLPSNQLDKVPEHPPQ